MTYEDRVRHRELLDRSRALKERLEGGEDGAPVTREEARDLASVVEELVERLSPERWDRLMEAIVEEATRRAAVAPVR